MTWQPVVQHVPKSGWDKATPPYQGMRIKLKDNLFLGYCQCWVKGSLGREEPQPSSCPALGSGWTEQGTDGVNTKAVVVLSSLPCPTEGLDQAELSILISSFTLHKIPVRSVS